MVRPKSLTAHWGISCVASSKRTPTPRMSFCLAQNLPTTRLNIVPPAILRSRSTRDEHLTYPLTSSLFQSREFILRKPTRTPPTSLTYTNASTKGSRPTTPKSKPLPMPTATLMSFTRRAWSWSGSVLSATQRRKRTSSIPALPALSESIAKSTPMSTTSPYHLSREFRLPSTSAIFFPIKAH